MKVVDVDFQSTVIPYFHRMPLKRETKHMALDGTYYDRSLKCPSRVSKMYFQGEGCIVFQLGSQGGNEAADCGNDR
jgi:hypothetical protein